MSDDFKPGDLVMLKSGGPLMTIVGIDLYAMMAHKTALCQWFDGKDLKEKLFELVALKKEQA